MTISNPRNNNAFDKEIEKRLQDNAWDTKIGNSVVNKHRLQIANTVILSFAGMLLVSTLTLSPLATLNAGEPHVASTQCDVMVEGTFFSESDFSESETGWL